MSSTPDRRIVTADDDGISSFFQRLASVSSNLQQGESILDYIARGPEIIEAHASAISRLAAGVDAFDLIELMRQRETPQLLDGYRESLADHLPAAVELVSIILLSRGTKSQMVGVLHSEDPRTIVLDLHSRANELLMLSSFMLLTDGAKDKHGPLTTLAATYVSQEVSVRVKQYSHIQDQLNEELFSSTYIDDLLVEALGFSYEDYLAVRDAIHRIYVNKIFAAQDALREIAAEWAANSFRRQDDERIDQGRTAAQDLFIFPGRRASFTSEEVAAVVSTPIKQIQAILDKFSIDFEEEIDAAKAVEAFLSGENPFRNAALVHDGDGNFITVNVPIGTDCFRQVAEAALKPNSKQWRRYERRRTLVSESTSLQALTKLLGTEPLRANLKYFRPNPGVDPSELNNSAQDITRIAEQTEADGLFLIEDVAICVEVKGRSISSQARGGHVQRLANDLRTTVGEATEQALRLEELIRVNQGLWLDDRSWLDLSSVREIRSIAVCLDDMGPLATALDELIRGGVIGEDRFPWIISLHDLIVVSEVVERPSEFLLYLRRRTESEVSLSYEAIDELDLFMLFLSGQLYVEPDPDRVNAEFLGVRNPSKADKKRRADSAVPTRVMTHTDPLDAWMYYVEGSSEVEAVKPEFRSHPDILRLVDFLQDGHKPGWFRFSADLLNLSDEGQEKLAKSVLQLVSSTRADHQHHSLFTAFAGAWGYPALFVGTQPNGMPRAMASEKLAVYGTAKKHQIKSDRSLLVLLNEHGDIESVRYDNRVPENSQLLDAVGKNIGLTPVEVMARPVPPSARRATKRLSPRKPKRKSK